MPAENAMAGGGSSFIPLIVVFFIFYFLVIRPQQKKQKETEDMVKKLEKNDEVITTAGIHGVVTIVKEKTVVVRVDDGVRIEFDKDAIVSKKQPEQTTQKESK